MTRLNSLLYVHVVVAQLAFPQMPPCYDTMIVAVNDASLFADSKTFVDMPLTTNLSDAALCSSFVPTRDFLDAHFGAPGTDLVRILFVGKCALIVSFVSSLSG